MKTRKLSGDRALALGAAHSGVSLVTGYPGSPSSGTLEALIDSVDEHDIYIEWSSNERVALEMAVGASIAGRRSLVCTKSVGLNVMIDPLMALNLTPVHGGLVILLGDDPGGYGSQNDQDSRPLAASLEIPVLEPSSPDEGYSMIKDAFDLSEKLNTVIIIRETRSFTQQEEPVVLPETASLQSDLGFIREPFRFVPVPDNAVEKHRNLHKIIEETAELMEEFPYNRISGHGEVGIIGAGFAYRKLLDVTGNENPENYRLLKLGTVYPLPPKKINEFLKPCRKVLIFEENEPYLEIQIKSIAYDAGSRTDIYGKQSGHVSREGELYRRQIRSSLQAFLPGFLPAMNYPEEKPIEERPKKKNHCKGCRYDEVLDMLEEAAKDSGRELVLVGDPGCLVTVAGRLDAKYAIGSAIGVADGLGKAGIKKRAVAIFGDSAFFHSSLPALCNAVHNRSRILMIVLDNQATATSGFQPNPGVGRDALGRKAPALSIEKIARACGVKHVYLSPINSSDQPLVEIFRNALKINDLVLVIVRLPGRA